ncbi:MAG TPA: FliH/SctL family protein [Tepidisphaeraceae bacterium]|nr:FliH/SctL family protein [Tepidisphaeraceae bacterium]
MGFIKAGNVATKAAAFSMKDIEDHAKSLLLRARQQVEQLLAAAQAEAETLKQQAKAAGFEEGRREGLAKGREEGLKAGRDEALSEQRGQLGKLAAALTGAATELETSRRELEAAALKDVIRLAIAIAERVTKRQGALDPQVAIANVNDALRLVVHASDVRIAMHPSQMAMLREVLPQLKSQWPALEHVELIEDASLAPGGCRVFTAHGQVDGDLDEQLKRIVTELLPEAEASV